MTITAPVTPVAENAPAGIAWMLATIFWFVTLDAVAKHLLVTYPVAQVVWARFFFHTLLVGLFVAGSLGRTIVSRHLKLQIVRSLLMVLTTSVFFYGVSLTPLATASTIMFLAPIFITLLAVPMLGENVGPRRLMGVFIGFAGALIVVQPQDGFVSTGAIFLLLAALSNAVYQIVTRLVRVNDNPMTSLLYTGIAGAVVLSFVVPFYWIAPTTTDWALFVAIGAAGGIGHLCLIRAFRLAPASVVAPFGYSSLIWASLYGFMLFGEIPGVWTLAGAGIIMASGLYIFHRERQVAARTG